MNSVNNNYYLPNPVSALLSFAADFCSLVWALAAKIGSLAESIFDSIDRYFYDQPALCPLRIVPIKPEDFPTACKTIEIWKSFAERQNLRSCRQLCVCILDQIQRRPHSFDEAYACIDARKNLQGVLFLSLNQTVHSENPSHQGRFVKINYLMTRPQQNHDKVKGAGSLLVDFAQKRSDQCHQSGVMLESVASAETFYEKLGFEKIDAESTERECQPMIKKMSLHLS